VHWIGNEAELRRTIRQRIKGGSVLIKGATEDVEKAFEVGREWGFIYTIVLVQPGVSKSGLSPKLAAVLAAADDYVRHGAAEPLVLLASP
jgi:hypothetical protein